MSQHVVIKIPRASDKLIVKAFKYLLTTYSLSTSSAMAVGFIDLGAFPVQDEIPPAWSQLLGFNSGLIASAHVAKGGFSVAYYRGGSDSGTKSGVFDEIRISFNQQGGEPTLEERLKISAYLTKELKAFEPDRATSLAITEEAQHFAALHQSTLERLEQLAEDIIRRTTETQSRLDAEHSEKKRATEQELAERKNELDTAHAANLTKLREREENLEAKLKEVDDRGNTHARREIRNKMLDDVKDRIQNFGVSRNTSKKREPVLAGIFVLVAIFVVAMGITLTEIDGFYKNSYGTSVFSKDLLENSKPTQKTVLGTALATTQNSAKPTEPLDRNILYFLWARFSVFMLGAVGTLLYYIRWQNRWAEQHSSSEFQLQQFYIDVNRANWVIESGLEWRKETSSEVPDIILSSVTKNLFNAQNEPAPALHPADELASALLGTASKLKLKTGQSELEFNKPSKIPK